MSAAAVILAAGKAKRAGGPKAVWPVGGRPSVRRVAEAALAAPLVAEVLAVTGGPWAGAVAEALAGLPVRLVDNPRSDLGQAESLKAGLRALDPVRSTVIFLLADQPFITSQIINNLLTYKMEWGSSIIAPIFGGRRRNPVAFDLTLWRERLLALEGDQGGRDVLTENPVALDLWPADSLPEECFMDFDTRSEYERLACPDPKP